jgi:hypothetical protein
LVFRVFRVFRGSISSYVTSLSRTDLAVRSGCLDAVQVLVEAGAERGVHDTAWQGTPLGWPEYGQREKKSDDDVKRYTAITTCVREKGGS